MSNQNHSELLDMQMGKSSFATSSTKAEDKKKVKVALITGSSGGIGAKIALDLVNEGFMVAITGTNLERVNRIVEQCNESLNGSAFAFVGDLGVNENVDRLIELIRSRCSCLNVLINNVCSRGESTRNLFSDDDDLLTDDIESTFKLNCNLPLYIVHKLLKAGLFPKKNLSGSKGVVVNISSIAAQVVVPLHLYSITKACMAELTKQLASLSDVTNVWSVTISPGPVLTDERPHHLSMRQFTLLNNVGSTQDISALVLFAIKNAESFNGQNLTVDGGYTAKQVQPSPVRRE